MKGQLRIVHRQVFRRGKLLDPNPCFMVGYDCPGVQGGFAWITYGYTRKLDAELALKILQELGIKDWTDNSIALPILLQASIVSFEDVKRYANEYLQW